MMRQCESRHRAYCGVDLQASAIKEKGRWVPPRARRPRGEASAGCSDTRTRRGGEARGSGFSRLAWTLKWGVAPYGSRPDPSRARIRQRGYGMEWLLVMAILSIPLFLNIGAVVFWRGLSRGAAMLPLAILGTAW